MQIMLAQINLTIGDLSGNTERILRAIEHARKKKVDLVIFPEMALSGYPPEDFILLPHFMEAVSNQLQKIIDSTSNIAVIVGLPRKNPDQLEKNVYNSAAFIQNGKLIDFADKILLPTYDVFDERRYFEPGRHCKVWHLHGMQFGMTICEDLWQHSGLLQSAAYRRDPILELENKSISFLINISASPYSFNKLQTRVNVCLRAASHLKCPVLLCNQVGGNDSLIFDGHSVYANQHGLLQCARGFEEDMLLADLSISPKPIEMKIDLIGDLLKALILGVRDYFTKSGFKKACLGLSGGIDSAVAACIAAKALGSENILAIGMPSRYSSLESARDAAILAKNLGIEYREIPIEQPFTSYLQILASSFEGRTPDVTEENLQARIRGMLLMAFSNKFGYLVLSTGNKSELALGYSTLYGDMCGGLSVIGDLTKRQVYALARQVNLKEEIIPRYTIERAPSAELRPGQKDSDSLPDYDIVDQVLQAYVEEHRPPEWIARTFNYPQPLVDDLIKRIHLNEYKRRQAPPALRISEKAFSVGRRFPIVQRWV